MKISLWFSIVLVVPSVNLTHAGSATWNLNPTSADWNTVANWTPKTVPNSTTDVANFDSSSEPNVLISNFIDLNSVVYDANADVFTITISSGGQHLWLHRTGVINNSGITQQIVVGTDQSAAGRGNVSFFQTASAGENVTYTITPNGLGFFAVSSTASTASFDVQGGPASGASSGLLEFYTQASADSATIINEGGQASGAPGGVTHFYNAAQTGGAILIANGGAVNGADGGEITIDGSQSGTAQVKLYGNGSLACGAQSMTLGSLEGDGTVTLNSTILSPGSLNTTTTFSGIIQGNGSLTKIGSGTLTLSGANTYDGLTTVSAGVLKVANQTGSATGLGIVSVSTGTLGGPGIVAGDVTVGTGTGTGAFLAPSTGAGQPTTLTLQNTLTFKADGAYTYKLNTKKAKADQVRANGVTIASGAQFAFSPIANKKLTAGKVFTAISNTSATPISGTFANLPDGSTFIAGRNNYQVSYSGGDGNDLTLTVVP